jgi:hypothetical protein
MPGCPLPGTLNSSGHPRLLRGQAANVSPLWNFMILKLLAVHRQRSWGSSKGSDGADGGEVPWAGSGAAAVSLPESLRRRRHPGRVIGHGDQVARCDRIYLRTALCRTIPPRPTCIATVSIGRASTLGRFSRSSNRIAHEVIMGG